MQQIQVGETLSKGFRVFFQGLPTLLGIAVPIYAPYIAIELIYPGDINEFTGMHGSNPFAILISIFLGPFVTAACTYEVLQRLRGERAGVGECLLVGLRRLFPVLMVTILVMLAIFLGFVCFIVPGVILWVAMIAAAPVCVVERPGILKSLERSYDLTRGSRWPIFGILLIFGLIAGMAGAIPAGIGVAARMGGIEAATTILLWVLVAVNVLAGVLNSVFAATIYHDLRTKKEGAQSDELVQVFA